MAMVEDLKECEFQQELQKAIFKIGISELFNSEKIAERVKQHFEEIGKLEELKKYLEKKALSPSFCLMEEVDLGIEAKIPFYSLLENEGIFWSPEGFLLVNGEKIAYVGEEIIPLRGKKEELKRVLEKIVEMKKELSNGKIESNNPFVKALTHLDELPEYDMEEKLKQKSLKKSCKNCKFRKKILEELPYVKINKTKNLV